MYQERAYLSRNWEPLPVPSDRVDAILLTHAHLDHAGLIPKLVRDGFSGRVLATAASRDLAEIVLTDAGHIQEEDAAFKKRRHAREGRRGRYPEIPLYTARDAVEAMNGFEAVPYGKPVHLNSHLSVTFHDAGHILGSAILEIVVREGGAMRTFLFSGDLGQVDKPILRDPSLFLQADYIVLESTYGGRNHEDTRDIDDQLAEAINAAVAKGGNVLIPVFAVERAQELMYRIGELLRDDRIPHLLAFLDSPMAVDVTEVFRRHHECMDAEALERLDAGERLFQFPGLRLVRHVSESKAINRIRGSCMVMAGSGMCTAGRIKHHLVRNISRPECAILFVGYQAHGTLGRHIVDGADVVRIHGAEHPVRARIVQIHGLSAHADQDGLIEWLGHLQTRPRRVFLTHGEESSAEQLASAIRTRWGWDVDVPAYKTACSLD
jgi:metallo-beta-lactamase family protein